MRSRPTANFARVTLDIADIPGDTVYRRIFFKRNPDPLGFGKTPSRFCDPRRRVPESRFGVLYLGSTLKVCFLEAVLRDLRNGQVGDYPLDETELRARVVATIAPTRPLRLLDLRGDGPVRMGIPTDVVRGATQTLARAWSVAFYDHPDKIDGIIYPSRINEEHNLAIYDRAVPALAVAARQSLLATRGIAAVLNELKVALS